ncbi:hypothetical protein MNBD_GAMMA17-257 [hydrothermal vent metagenome]|uniref:Uncharacterized protein n=1 Tax=hydrothermal vent metagenome TaxID=652676 RepID=A0A3B0ZP34_9ZZZZ
MSEIIKTILGAIGIAIAALSALVIIVDGVAIIFTYVSLLFALFLIGGKNKRMLKAYGVMFMLAHFVLGWRIVIDTNKNDVLNGAVPMDFRYFRVCSDKMFQNIGESQVELTAENRAEFSKCMSQ